MTWRSTPPSPFTTLTPGPAAFGIHIGRVARGIVVAMHRVSRYQSVCTLTSDSCTPLTHLRGSRIG